MIFLLKRHTFKLLKMILNQFTAIKRAMTNTALFNRLNHIQDNQPLSCSPKISPSVFGCVSAAVLESSLMA